MKWVLILAMCVTGLTSAQVAPEEAAAKLAAKAATHPASTQPSAALLRENARLKAENEQLKHEIYDLKDRIAALKSDAETKKIHEAQAAAGPAKKIPDDLVGMTIAEAEVAGSDKAVIISGSETAKLYRLRGPIMPEGEMEGWDEYHLTVVDGKIVSFSRSHESRRRS